MEDLQIFRFCKDMEDVPITPSPPESAISAGSGREGGGPEQPKKARRTFLTQNACTRCESVKCVLFSSRHVMTVYLSTRPTEEIEGAMIQREIWHRRAH